MDIETPLRERLVDVGVELVASEGTAALGLREIARRAGVSHGAPRRYFPTHHTLLSAIAHRGFADLKARFAAAGESTAAPRERLAAIATAYVRFAVENPGMFELMFRHDLLDSDGQASDQPRLRETTLPLFRGLVDLVARHQAEAFAHRPGKAGGPEVTTAALWANVHGIAQLWSRGSLPLMLEGEPPGADRLAELLGAALDAHLGPVRR
ncbi:TetR/AcrR family transcriptional regulator [Streptomyces odontomachi]|uniref:TetR/AcrR family transcriptional regulator n=1 Tax=Streptomyces odontomachi TaxID=2944940 RepID=UPI00210C22C4|nr:TetR/AcrR family transcriptional regulator [Streptomyces sp. ODS25]